MRFLLTCLIFLLLFPFPSFGQSERPEGIVTSSDGEKYEGEWKGGKEWNGKLYDKDGKIIRKFVNGVKQ